jgi:adenylyltransferase/sulfurtransferase
VTARELAASLAPRVVLDVRPRTQFQLCALQGAVSVPWDDGREPDEWVVRAEDALRGSVGDIFVVCRFGNDSRVAARCLLLVGLGGGNGHGGADGGNGGARWIGDVIGGLKAWRETVDPDFPDY